MSNLLPLWRDWIPLMTAILGLIVGAVLSELRVLLAGARERRRALNVLLYDLLELRLDIRAANPRAVIDAIYRLIHERFGDRAAPPFKRAEFQAIIMSVRQEVSSGERSRLTERYEGALRSLVPCEPLLAYRLAGNERIAALERAIFLYYERMAQLPDVVKDPQGPQILSVIQDKTVELLMEDVLQGLSKDVIRIARARGWWLCRWVWMPWWVWWMLRRQDGLASEKLDRVLGEWMDRFLPKVVAAVMATVQPETQNPG